MRLLLTVVCFGLVTAAGCKRAPGGLTFEPCDAMGKVIFEGKPLASGTVTFVPTIPESRGGHPGLASIDAAGAYHLGNAESGRASALKPGQYVVTVLTMEIDRSQGKPAP